MLLGILVYIFNHGMGSNSKTGKYGAHKGAGEFHLEAEDHYPPRRVPGGMNLVADSLSRQDQQHEEWRRALVRLFIEWSLWIKVHVEDISPDSLTGVTGVGRQQKPLAADDQPYSRSSGTFEEVSCEG